MKKRFTVPVAGQKIQISLVQPKHKVFEGETLHGLTVAHENKVYFALGYPQSTFESTYSHELLGHISFAVAGVDIMLRENLKEGVDPGDFEEEMIRRLDLVWYPLLTFHTFQFPKVSE